TAPRPSARSTTARPPTAPAAPTGASPPPGPADHRPRPVVPRSARPTPSSRAPRTPPRSGVLRDRGTVEHDVPGGVSGSVEDPRLLHRTPRAELSRGLAVGPRDAQGGIRLRTRLSSAPPSCVARNYACASCNTGLASAADVPHGRRTKGGAPCLRRPAATRATRPCDRARRAALPHFLRPDLFRR